MNEGWSTSPNAHRVLQHADDARPAWLWSGDGKSLIWANAAAGLFLAKLKKHGLKRAPLAIPIKGQVSRIIRLGVSGRTSLARIQFLAGEKAVSATCATTPLHWEQDQPALLIVAVDPVAPDILAAAEAEDGESAEAATGRPEAEPAAEPPAETEGAAAAEAEPALEDWHDPETEAPPEPAEQAPDIGTDDPQAWASALADKDADEDPPAEPQDEAEPSAVSRRLSALVDRLAADEALYTPLTAQDDLPPAAAAPAEAEEDEQNEANAPAGDEPETAAPVLYRVTGRGFRPEPATAAGEPDSAVAIEDTGPVPADEAETGQAVEPQPEAAAAGVESAETEARPAVSLAEPAPPAPADAEAVERVSRYNFDELSRILTDRVGDLGPSGDGADEAPAPPPALPEAVRSGSLVNLGGETLVLNRLPLGILVFRDQQVLFANRAITEMIGYDSVEALRAAGLAAVFPATGPAGQEAGPVNHLVQRDGTLVPVTARLQSISWQGRPALMLSASATEVRTGHEEAVRAFAQTFADIRGDGYFETNRAGTVSQANAAASGLLAAGKPLAGQTLSGLVSADDGVALRAFLERPARFAETARPCLALRSADGRAEILLFAQGQAGVLSGYFGFVRGRETTPARLAGPADIDPALLARISRGVRRPLNTIVGFSDLIRSEAFGALGNERYEGYADDIARAGQEIAALVDELDDYVRLRDGRYLPQRASLDLTSLLESCVVRIRDQANAARVIVRNAISETLPRVTADRASLAQAVLNLLASAIDQTPTGGAVVISAQYLDDGGIAIHVRDSSAHAVDMAERFVVFRDGVGKDGQMLAPVRSSVGLALTRSLLAVNAVSLSVDPAGAEGMLFTLKIPADLVETRKPAAPV